jgi:hypothetical protein
MGAKFVKKNILGGGGGGGLGWEIIFKIYFIYIYIFGTTG